MTGLLGFLLVPFWVLLHVQIKQAYGKLDPAPAMASPDEQAAKSDGVPLCQVLSSRRYTFLLGARALTDTAWYFYLFWIPGYFQEVRGLSLAQIGRLMWIPYLSADGGALAGAWASSSLIARGWGRNRSRKTTMLMAALLAVLGVQAYYAASSLWAVGLVSLALFGHLAWSSNLHTAITEVAPPKYVALLYGATGAAGTLLGAVSQPLIGRSVDQVGYEPVFWGGGLFFAFAAALVLAAGKIERIGDVSPSSP